MSGKQKIILLSFIILIIFGIYSLNNYLAYLDSQVIYNFSYDNPGKIGFPFHFTFRAESGRYQPRCNDGTYYIYFKISDSKNSSKEFVWALDKEGKLDQYFVLPETFVNGTAKLYFQLQQRIIYNLELKIYPIQIWEYDIKLQ